MKKILMILMLLIFVINLTGCADATYNIGVNTDGTFSASYIISSSISEDDQNIDLLGTVKNEFEDAGYDVSTVEENGKKNVIISKKYVTINANEKVNVEGVQINPMHYISNGARLTRGFMKNIIKIDADIDLTALNPENISLADKYETKIKSDLEKNIVSDENSEEVPEITQEMIDAEKKALLEKYLSEMNIKLVLKTKGNVLKHNSTITSANGKETEWILIPGTSNNIIFECTTGFDKAFLGTAVILGVTLLLALFLAVYLIKVYLKQFKN